MAYDSKNDKLITLNLLQRFWENVKSKLGSYLPLTGGTLTGNLSGQYITGTWLQATAANHTDTKQDKVAVFDGSGWLYYRTLAELKSDIGTPDLTGYAKTDDVSTAVTNHNSDEKAHPALIDRLNNIEQMNYKSVSAGQIESTTGTIIIPYPGYDSSAKLSIMYADLVAGFYKPQNTYEDSLQKIMIHLVSENTNVELINGVSMPTLDYIMRDPNIIVVGSTDGTGSNIRGTFRLNVDGNEDTDPDSGLPRKANGFAEFEDGKQMAFGTRNGKWYCESLNSEKSESLILYGGDAVFARREYAAYSRETNDFFLDIDDVDYIDIEYNDNSPIGEDIFAHNTTRAYTNYQEWTVKKTDHDSLIQQAYNGVVSDLQAEATYSNDVINKTAWTLARWFGMALDHRPVVAHLCSTIMNDDCVTESHVFALLRPYVLNISIGTSYKLIFTTLDTTGKRLGYTKLIHKIFNSSSTQADEMVDYYDTALDRVSIGQRYPDWTVTLSVPDGFVPLLHNYKNGYARAWGRRPFRETIRFPKADNNLTDDEISAKYDISYKMNGDTWTWDEYQGKQFIINTGFGYGIRIHEVTGNIQIAISEKTK